MGSAGQQ